jgi:predicted RNA-binding protein YlxR (DUF448 family)
VARGGNTPRPRHVPQRTCVACRQGRDKRDLVRVVRTVAGNVEIDPTGKKSGRGAYLCRDPRCWHTGLRRGALTRALKIESLPRDDALLLAAFSDTLQPLGEPGASGETSHRPAPTPISTDTTDTPTAMN